MHRFVTFILSIFLATAAFSQTVKVSGIVKDAATGEGVIGAAVQVKGTSVVTVTSLDGDFSISAAVGQVIVVSSMGYEDASFTVSGPGPVEVQLMVSSEYLDDVVVIGYGSMKRVNVTGAVDMVGSDAFEGRQNSSVSQMLQGQIPNLNLKFTDGRPNASPSYNIRGTTSIGQGGSALVLIDGVEGDPVLLNPNDIESVSVLKDAASSAIYGSRAPYGVVLITTKNADKEKFSVSYSTNLSFESPTAKPDYVTDGYTYAQGFYDAYYNYNYIAPASFNKGYFTTAWLTEYRKRAAAGDYGIEVSDGSYGLEKGQWVYFIKGVDYIDMLYKRFQFAQTHNLSMSGSSGKFSYYLSGRLYDNDGIYACNEDHSDWYKTYNTRLKISYDPLPWLRLTNNLDIAKSLYRTPQNNVSEAYGNVHRTLADNGHTCFPVTNPDGTMTYSGIYSIGDFLYGHSYRLWTNTKAQDTMGAQIHLFDDAFRINADFTYKFWNNHQTQKKTISEFSRNEGVTETISGRRQYLEEDDKDYEYLSANAYAEYEKTFGGKHYLKGLLGYNYEQQTYKYVTAYNDDLLTEDVVNLALAMGKSNMSVGGNYYKWRLAGFFFRLNYFFDERYLLEVNGRYDGSSKFPAHSRWAFFPSVSAGWRISKEPWFKVDPSKVSNLKVRASYGSLGNSNVSAYAYDEKFSFDTGGNFNGSNVRYTAAPAPVPDNLTWETSRTLDAGVDLALLNNRLIFTGDFYRRETLNMYTQGPTLPSVYGHSSPKGNYANLLTTGYELVLEWRDAFRMLGSNFNYSIRGTLADYISTITKYNNANKTLSTFNDQAAHGNYYEGMRIGEIWGYTVNGLWQTQEEIDEAMQKAVSAGHSSYNTLMQTSRDYVLHPGDIKVEDLNGNGYIDRGLNTVDDSGDRRIIGNSEPRYCYSFKVDFDWKGVFFNMFWQGVGKQDWYPATDTSVFWGQYNRPYNPMLTWQVGNFWTEDNTDAYLPRYTGYYGAFFDANKNANTRYLQDVSYIRLKSLQVGYSFPKKLLEKIHVQNLRVFFSGENIWTWSPMYKHTRNIDVTANIYGYDAVLTTSGDGYNFPTMKSYSFGLDITF